MADDTEQLPGGAGDRNLADVVLEHQLQCHRAELPRIEHDEVAGTVASSPATRATWGSHETNVWPNTAP